jgi:hypothetical protein
MTCDAVRDWLANADDPENGKTFPVEVVDHCRQCAACEAFRSRLNNLERRWRELPLPANAESSKAAFLLRLVNPPSPTPERKPGIRRRRMLWGGAIAAVLFLVGGVGILFFGPAKQAEAHPDVLEQLIDWNLDMSEAPSPADRQRLYTERHDNLKKSVEKAKLNADDRALAEDLLANGAWMAHNEDPVEELNRFDTMADRLLERVETSTADPTRADRFATQFRRVNERAIERNLEKIKLAKITDPQKKKMVQKLLKKDAERADLILKVLEKSPDLTKKELRQVLEQAHKRIKSKKS